jgi:glycosyltransferase involved in cell wall biosynthesis
MIRKAGFPVRPYEVSELSIRRPAAFLSMSRHLANCFRAERVDLVHCSDLQAAYNGGLASRLARIPAICHIRSRYSSLSRRDQLLLAPISHFVFVSQETRKRFSLPVRSSRATVVYDGLDVPVVASDPAAGQAFRKEFQIDASAPVIGTLARVAEVKDYFTLARAVKRLVASRPDAVVLIVGDNESTPNYRKHYATVRSFIADLGLTKNFVFTGHRTDIHHALSAMDVFVLSTHLEGLPLVLIEAAAHCLPIVATDVDGVPEIITHGETGLLAPHLDDAILARHLLHYLDDTDDARRLGLAAKARLLQHFNERQFAAGMKQVYSKMIPNLSLR